VLHSLANRIFVNALTTLNTRKREVSDRRIMPMVMWQSSTCIALPNEVEFDIRIHLQVKTSSMAGANCVGGEQRSLLHTQVEILALKASSSHAKAMQKVAVMPT